MFILTGFQGGLTRQTYLGLKHAPPDDNYYLAMNYTGHLDFDVFYNDFGSSIANARTADILILGNSRANFAFDPEVLKQFGNRHSLKIFNMSFPGEAVKWSRLLIERFDLRPKLVIVHAETTLKGPNAPFFADVFRGAVPLGQSKLSRSWFLLVRFVQWRLLLLRATFVPKWLDPYLTPMPKKWDYRYIYRSELDGSYTVDSFENEPEPTKPGGLIDHPNPLEFQLAERFQQMLEQRGSKLILTTVPHDWACYGCVTEIADKIGVPAIIIGSHEMMIRDGGAGHLTPQSAKLFTELLLEQIEHLSDFRILAPNAAPAKRAFTVEIDSASYGANCGAPTGNVTSLLRGICQSRRFSPFRVEVSTLGDPANGCGKDFAVTWRCGSEMHNADLPPGAGFGEYVELRCNGDQKHNQPG